MRKMFIAIVMLFSIASCEYDDSFLKEKVEELENRVLTLEQLCAQMNTNISSLQALLDAMQQYDYITNITPITQGNTTTGYTINFAKGNPITIYHGTNGSTPVIGVEKAEDGMFYWTLNEEWLTDNDGNKIQASAKDGITPKLKIEKDNWYVSFDGGESWEPLGKAKGEDGDAFFKEIIIGSYSVEFVLLDGSSLIIPRNESSDYMAVTTADELTQAATNATADVTIFLANDITGNARIPQKEDVKITIIGENHTYNGVIVVEGKSSRYATTGLTIQNVNFNAEGISADACINLGESGNSATRYTNNVTVKNCTFSGSEEKKVAIKSYTGGDHNLNVIGCTVNNGMHSLAQLANIEVGLKFEDCKVYSKNGVNLNQTPAFEMSSCTFDVKGYAIRVGVAGDANVEQKIFTVSNSTLKSACAESDDAVIVFRGSATNAKLTLTNTTLEGSVQISGNTNETIIDEN